MAAAQLFAKAIYKEYKIVVISITVIIICIFVLIVLNSKNWWRVHLLFWWKFVVQMHRATVDIYKQLKNELFKQ